MSGAREIKQRIRSAKNISKITKAMEMVSASKMRKSQMQAQASRPYAKNLDNILATISEFTNASSHPLLEQKTQGKDLIVIVSTDRGLVGGLNANLFRAVSQLMKNKQNVEGVSIGKRSRNFLQRVGLPIFADFSNMPDRITYNDILPLTTLLMNAFLNEGIKSVTVVHMESENSLSQKAVVTNLLPVSAKEIEESETSHTPTKEYTFEPSPQAVLNWLLPYFVENAMYFILLEAKASEHSARMVSMKNASDNAKEVVSVLNLQYNRSRQAAITKELQEITTAQMTL